MFDILVYLIESFAHNRSRLETGQLTERLLAEGFDEDEVSEAVEWLAGLTEAAAPESGPHDPAPNAVRLYVEAERNRFHPDCFAYLSFMEQTGILDAASREIIVAQALALKKPLISLRALKLTAFMVLWRRERAPDALIVEELLSDSPSGAVRTLH